MHSLAESTVRILQIEARQDDLLRQLGDLDDRVEQALAESLSLTARAAVAATHARLLASPTASPSAIEP